METTEKAVGESLRELRFIIMVDSGPLVTKFLLPQIGFSEWHPSAELKLALNFHRDILEEKLSLTARNSLTFLMFPRTLALYN